MWFAVWAKPTHAKNVALAWPPIGRLTGQKVADAQWNRALLEQLGEILNLSIPHGLA